jgi:tetratricopeptide (TPR) repeat protein
VRPAPFLPAWLAANGSAVVGLAQEVEANHRFDLLPVLGDALEDAGCADDVILRHCRSGEPHAWGCWVTGGILGEPEWTEARRYGVAVNFWSLRLCCNGDDQYALGERGFASSKIGRYDDLLEDINALLALNPGYAWAYEMRGHGHQQKKQHELALTDFNRANELNPNQAWTQASLGDAYNSLERFDEALACLDRAVELNPQYGWARGKRGYAYLSKGEHGRAIEEFTYALERCPGYADPERSWALATRGHAHLLLGQPERAIEDLTRAIETPGFAKHAEWVWAHGQRATAHLKRGDYAQARQDFGAGCHEVAGLNTYAWSLATYPDDAFRDGQRAVELATRACELSSWKDANYIDTLAAAHAEAGDYAKAVRLQEQALALGPLDDEARRRLDLYRAGRPFRTR